MTHRIDDLMADLTAESVTLKAHSRALLASVKRQIKTVHRLNAAFGFDPLPPTFPQEADASASRSEHQTKPLTPRRLARPADEQGIVSRSGSPALAGADDTRRGIRPLRKTLSPAGAGNAATVVAVDRPRPGRGNPSTPRTPKGNRK
jgi:hypothetical protein